MIRYRLDELGWFQFECLAQSLMKAEVSLSVETWSGHSDHGRDAFTKHRLRYPDRNALQRGPFLFQVKFVQNANAAGAKPGPALIEAVAKEADRIARRMHRGTWAFPRVYVLITNVATSPRLRETIGQHLAEVLPDTKITLLCGQDVCDLIDKHSSLRRSFPEILSLRDLDVLLSEVVNRAVVERSRAAVQETREIVSVFVPVAAYRRAWKVLHKHSFVVLDGPPEMGKTAIARMISMVQLFHGWQLTDCRGPDDFFGSFESSRPQIFVADDAFGRTEYDPSLGRVWERDLARVLCRVDDRHWLVWTSRKHILARALKEMDLTGRAHNFPAPAEVLVTAEHLSLEEKARILYRHARHAALDDNIREVIKTSAKQIVQSEHFTPERIRRFVREAIPDLRKAAKESHITLQDLQREVLEAIKNPTKRMALAYKKLPDQHRLVLTSLLEHDQAVPEVALLARCRKWHPDITENQVRESLDDLVGTFVKRDGGSSKKKKCIDWIHPSYRDLVIEELARETERRAIFVKSASLSGIKLAISTMGGGTGRRTMPLMVTDEDWQALHSRCVALTSTGDSWCQMTVLEALTSALSAEGGKSDKHRKLGSVLRAVCDEIYRRWLEFGPPTVGVIETYGKAIHFLDPPPPFPDPSPLWDDAYGNLRESQCLQEDIEPERLEEWTRITSAIAKATPVFLRSEGRRKVLEAMNEDIAAKVEAELRIQPKEGDPDGNEAQADRLFSIYMSLDRLSKAQEDRTDLVDLSHKVRHRWHQFYEKGQRGKKDDEDEGDESEKSRFDIEAFFADL